MQCHTQLLKVGSEDRTHNLMFVQQALSQLSYLPSLAVYGLRMIWGFPMLQKQTMLKVVKSRPFQCELL